MQLVRYICVTEEKLYNTWLVRPIRCALDGYAIGLVRFVITAFSVAARSFAAAALTSSPRSIFLFFPQFASPSQIACRFLMAISWWISYRSWSTERTVLVAWCTSMGSGFDDGVLRFRFRLLLFVDFESAAGFFVSLTGFTSIGLAGWPGPGTWAIRLFGTFPVGM